jgi:peptide/nickel transport system substrate-binding protein
VANRPSVLLAVAAGAALTMTACSSGGGGNTNPSNQKAKQAAASQNQVNPLPYNQVPDGGSLRWPIESFPANFNPYEVDADLGEAQLTGSALPTVWHFKADGTSFLDKDVVDSASSTTTTPQVVKYHINPKAVWSDGTPITYQDFVGMFDALNGRNPAFKAASTSGYNQIQSVERGASDQDVTVTFATPFPEWQSLFSPLIPASLTASPTAFTKSWVNGASVSGGPFIIDKIDKTARTITVKRNDKWWGQKPKLDTITFIVLDVSAQPKAYQSDQIDWFDIGPDPAAYTQAVQGGDIRKAGGPNFRHIDLGQKGAMANLQVRQAVMLSLDRMNDAQAMLSALDWPATTMDSHVWTNNQAQYKATCGDYCKTDDAKAGSLLEAAGYTKNGNGYYAKDGKDLTLSFVIPAGVSSSATEAGIQQANAALDASKRVDLTYQADQMIWEEGHSATLYQRPDLVACKKTLVNFGALGYADIDYSIIGFES